MRLVIIEAHRLGTQDTTAAVVSILESNGFATRMLWQKSGDSGILGTR